MREPLPERVLSIVERALEELASPETPVSVALGRAIRVARLRSDGDNLIWLTLQTRRAGDEASRSRIVEEVRPYFSSYDELRKRWSAHVEEYIAERTFVVDGDEEVPAFGIAEIEARIESISAMATEDAGVAELAAEVTKAQMSVAQMREILARVRFRLIDYLTKVEKQVIFDELASSLFEGHRNFVDAKLQEVAPDALDQLAAAYRRRAENDAEARSHALTSCRRALKSIADALYPPASRPVIGADGVTRELTEARFLSRLIQYVYEASKTTDAALLRAQVAELGEKLERLNDLASKGVHDQVSDREVDHCVIQTYLTLGDVLRLHGGS